MGRRPRTVAAIAAVAALTAGGLAALGLSDRRGGNSDGHRLPIAGLVASRASARSVHAVPAGAARGATYVRDSGVLRLPGGELLFVPSGAAQPVRRPAGSALAEQAIAGDRAWLAEGAVPGDSPAIREMATRALLDMRMLARPGGAAVAAWYPRWRYVWPRDASFMAAAFAATGHHDEARRILGFLARVNRPDGTWEARYHPFSGAPVEDGRRWQLDASGWVPWATWFWYETHREPDARAEKRLQRLWPMVRAAADSAAASLGSRGLPPAGPDYWEIATGRPNLGTAAPLLAGLRCAADLARTLDHPESAGRYAAAAARLAGTIDTQFAPHYSRTIDPGSGADAAITFLAPPFAAYNGRVMRELHATARTLTLPNGGILPGEDWPGDPAQAWTPETALFALAEAASGHHRHARHWLEWLAAHRTRLGALPEKVNPDGSPASVAPLGWSGAIVLLALTAQHAELPVPPLTSDG